MREINYSDLKRGETYISYERLSNKKVVFVFKILDSKPVNSSFTIVNVIRAIWRDEDFNLSFRENFITSLWPCVDIFIFNEDDIRGEIIIPQL